MRKHNVWAVGGHVQRYFKPRDIDDLCAYLDARPDSEPLFWLGLGSNLLVRDGGIDGCVIAIAGTMDEIERLDEVRVRIGAGAPCAKVARFLVRQGLTGGEFLAGIPGTMGGALAMNAGAHGKETWMAVERLLMVNSNGRRRWRDAADFTVTYRSVNSPPGEAFAGCEMRFSTVPISVVQENVKKLLAHRAQTQPTGQRSCGSVFRNPRGDFAGRLIEAAGLKGARCGDAVVSEKHANFIVNDGGAKAADLEALIRYVQDTVLERFGIALVREVHIVGRRAA